MPSKIKKEARIVEKIEVETVPGNHLGMLTTHYEKLASVLSRYLEEAPPSVEECGSSSSFSFCGSGKAFCPSGFQVHPRAVFRLAFGRVGVIMRDAFLWGKSYRIHN